MTGPSPILPGQRTRELHAAKDAAEAGRGAFLLDGRMIDLPFVKRAMAVLADADDSSDRL